MNNILSVLPSDGYKRTGRARICWRGGLFVSKRCEMQIEVIRMANCDEHDTYAGREVGCWQAASLHDIINWSSFTVEVDATGAI